MGYLQAWQMIWTQDNWERIQQMAKAGLKPRITKLQVWHTDHLATLPPPVLKHTVHSCITRLRVVPHFSLGIVERAKRERAWKSPHARKGYTRWGERKMRDYRQSPSFWTNTLLSQRKTMIGPSMEICQHLSKTRQPLSTLNIHNLQNK